MKLALINIIGQYTPTITQSGDGVVVSPDYAWIMSCVICGIMLIYFMKAIYYIFKG